MSQTLPEPKRPKLVVVCPVACSFHPEKIGEVATAALLSMRQNGSGANTMSRRAMELLGRKVNMSTMQRHLAHYKEGVDPNAPEEESGPRPTDLAILDAIITSGFRHSKNWRPTIKDTLDAMKLKTQMTGQSAFEDMITAMNDAMDLPDVEEDEPVAENPEAVQAEGERGAEEPEEE